MWPSRFLGQASTSALLLGLTVSSIFQLTGCTRAAPTSPQLVGPAVDGPRVPPPPEVHAPEVKAPRLEAPISQGESEFVSLPNGAELVVTNFGGQHYFQAEATLTDAEYLALQASSSSLSGAEKKAKFKQEMSKIQGVLQKSGAKLQDSVSELGYLSFWVPFEPGRGLLERIKSLEFHRSLVVSPVVVDRESLRQLHESRPEDEGLIRRAAPARLGTRDFSGLERIGAPEFVKIAEEAIGGGVKVDGSSVKLGITDTGITYHHPTFEDAQGQSRVDYMRDFTGEGRVYFAPDVKLEAKEVDGRADELVLTAKIIATPKLPMGPSVDELTEVKDLRIKVGAELKALLLHPESKAKLGILFESNFQKLATEEDPAGEFADLNRNGKLDDKFYVILIPGPTVAEDVVYFDPSGTGDFRQARPIGDFNRTKSTLSVYAEKIGFDLREQPLMPKAGGDPIQVRSLSVVGYDPGNHGTHVAGIAAGKKTIANDSAGTLARGVAPNARIYMNRVCSNNAGCTATRAAIDLVLNGGVDLVNQSLGGLSPFNDGFSAEEVTVNRLVAEKNSLFVISAGNSGPGRQTVGSPSTARHSLSVGASATRGMIERQYQYPGLGASIGSGDGLSALDADFMLFFSSRGPTAAGGFKPNIAAPGSELSSVQINSAVGTRAGLDVYWGTSMAAPTAAGAYALLLDAVRKFNVAHPTERLTESALDLRQVIISTARGFDVKKLDLESGEKSEGQYTWVDQGTGMFDLPSAWRRLIELRNQGLSSAVTYQGKPVELDYTVLVSMDKNPTGARYDGSRAGGEAKAKQPVFGTGIYLDYFSTQTQSHVAIKRDLPAHLQGVPEAGELFRQLATTADEFELKTTLFGSDKVWLKAGVTDQLAGNTCDSAQAANLSIIGRGVDVTVAEDGTGSLNPLAASGLHVCIDRQVISQALAPGDHGALIEAYRVVNGKRAVVPSFVVPVYLAVPHRLLSDQTGYEIEGSVKSFGVNRHYVTIPDGATLVRVSLEVPELKVNSRGQVEKGEVCSGVELMALVGGNTLKPFKKRAEARVINCLETGALAAAGKRKLEWVTNEPKPGTWDLHVFGSYRNFNSKYRLKVDYVAAQTDRKVIEGGLSSLVGSVKLLIQSASTQVVPSAEKSQLELTGLKSSRLLLAAKGEQEFVPAPQATPTLTPPQPEASPSPVVTAVPAVERFRQYSADVEAVTVTTGESVGNDIDLAVVGCPAEVNTPEDSVCHPVGRSEGSTDVESVTFKPERGQKYAVLVAGYDIKDSGRYRLEELLRLKKEIYEVGISGAHKEFTATFHVTPEQLKQSAIAQHPLFVGKVFHLSGALNLRTQEGQILAVVPVKIDREE